MCVSNRVPHTLGAFSPLEHSETGRRGRKKGRNGCAYGPGNGKSTGIDSAEQDAELL